MKMKKLILNFDNESIEMVETDYCPFSRKKHNRDKKCGLLNCSTSDSSYCIGGNLAVFCRKNGEFTSLDMERALWGLQDKILKMSKVAQMLRERGA